MSANDPMDLDNSPPSSQHPLPSTYAPNEASRVAWQSSQVANPTLRLLVEQAKEDRSVARRRRHASPEDRRAEERATSASASNPSLLRTRARGSRTKALERSGSGTLSLPGGPTALLHALKDVSHQLDAKARNKQERFDKTRREGRVQNTGSAGAKRKLESRSTMPTDIEITPVLFGLGRPGDVSGTARTRSLGAMREDLERGSTHAGSVLSARHYSMPSSLQSFVPDESMGEDIDLASPITALDSPLPLDSRQISFISRAESSHSVPSHSFQSSQYTTPPASPPRCKPKLLQPSRSSSGSASPSIMDTSRPCTPTNGPPMVVPSAQALHAPSIPMISATRYTTPNPSTPRTSTRPSAARIKQLISQTDDSLTDSLPPPLPPVRPAVAARPSKPPMIRSTSSARASSVTAQASRTSQRPRPLGMRHVVGTGAYSGPSPTQSASHKLPAFKPPLKRPVANETSPSAARSLHTPMSETSPTLNNELRTVSPPPADADSSYSDIKPPFTPDELDVIMKPYD